MHVQGCCFGTPFSPFSFLLILPLVELPNVVIQKFRYHGNVTTHFSFLLRESLLWYKILQVHTINGKVYHAQNCYSNKKKLD